MVFDFNQWIAPCLNMGENSAALENRVNMSGSVLESS